ncbi:MAG: hypothetical protein PHS86_13245 [Syntrophaceae bacterium]|nr:hypothetical protein [Syntrophaceae bacterium]
MDFLDILREKAFLGREFLTWLWFKSDQTGGIIEIPGKKPIQVIFLDRMTLDLSDVETPQTVSIKGEYSELREGLAALREGKKIEEARISLKGDENEFTMVLKGTWLSFGSFKTPAILPSDERDADLEAEGNFLEKISLVEEGMSLVDDLFKYFVKSRISEAWELAEVPSMKKWAAE